LVDKIFQIPSEAPAVDGLVSLAVVEGAVHLCSDEGRITLDWLQVPDPRLVLDGIKDFFDGMFQRSEMLLRPEGSE